MRPFSLRKGAPKGAKVAVFDVGNIFEEPLKNVKSVENWIFVKKSLRFP